MTDADVDGSHIRTLLLTFFFRHMQDLIHRGHVFVAQPPLYLMKKGKSEKYIKNEKEFTREILRRATEDLKVEMGVNGTSSTLEGGELRSFLASLDEFQGLLGRLERRLRDGRVVDVLADAALTLDTKGEFQDRANIDGVAGRLRALKLHTDVVADEEHSAWTVVFRDQTNADRRINIDLAAQPEYRRMRTLARQLAAFNKPPFVVVRDSRRTSQTNWRDLLEGLKNDGKRDVAITRYKGLGEMNSEQLWETTMNAETRTLLRVELKDLVESDEIFSTLMGEDVESRRKFIEENALDVRNLDV
jgi:DNA gyrase subunit B